MTKKYLLASMVSVLIMVIGVSFAYFQTRIEGEGTNMTFEFKDLKIVFTDSAALNVSNINFGWNTTKTFTVQNLSNDTYNYNIILEDTLNAIVSNNSLQYKISSTNGGYSCDWKDLPKSLSTANINIASNVSIAQGVTQTYTLYLRYIENGEDQSEDMGKSFSGKLAIEKYVPTLVDKVLELNSTRLTRTDFSDVLTTTNTGTLYTTSNTEDGSTVYYFAGNALNNWVKFGKCTNASYNCTVGEDLYWRIIRTNTVLEDGGVRLLYAGSGSVSNTNAYIGTAQYYSSSNDPMYVGYMWGTTGSLANNRTNQTNKSNAATAISSWYTSTFNNNSDNNTKDSSGTLLTNYISPTAIYCNDRSVGSGSYSTSSSFDYGAYTRLTANNAPSLACGANTSGYGNYFEGTSSIADKFTGSAKNSSNVTIGNGLLGTTPAALITADEIAFAGGKNGTALTWYYYNAASTPGSSTGSTVWWTLSPYYWRSSNALVFYLFGSAYPGRLSYNYVYNSIALRPVISLSSDILWVSGDGSSTSPFEVSLAG